jgi:two-component system, chemotaxis family, response regulator Rcp1
MRHQAQPTVILVVDDDPDCRMLIREGILRAGANCRVCEASDGQSALDFIHHRNEHGHAPRPGLVYMDLELPDMMGGEALADIRRLAKDIPVVMMTGVCDEEEMRRAANNGANSYILKHAIADEFIRTVKVSTEYWLTIHQCPGRHMMSKECRR